MLPEYYNQSYFNADTMRQKVIEAHKHRAPPDIILFYILETIKALAALGYSKVRFKFIKEKDIINHLKKLGYNVEYKENYLTINWKEKN